MFRRSLFLALLIFACTLTRRSAAATHPNIVLVTLDTTRADRMGFLGSRSGLTPSLDGLARQSIVFERAYAQSPLTVVSHATILTGTYPQTHQVTELASPLGAVLPYLPDLLHARGYHTDPSPGSCCRVVECSGARPDLSLDPPRRPAGSPWRFLQSRDCGCRRCPCEVGSGTPV